MFNSIIASLQTLVVRPSNRPRLKTGNKLPNYIPVLEGLEVRAVPAAHALEPEHGWTALYYDNQKLVGLPTAVRIDPTINFDWIKDGKHGEIHPPKAIGRDNDFSVAWSGTVTAPEDGKYRFDTLTDDGVRVFVDGKLLIDEFHGQPPTAWHGDIQEVWKKGTKHSVLMEYFADTTGDEVSHLEWQWTAVDKGQVGKGPINIATDLVVPTYDVKQVQTYVAETKKLFHSEGGVDEAKQLKDHTFKFHIGPGKEQLSSGTGTVSVKTDVKVVDAKGNQPFPASGIDIEFTGAADLVNGSHWLQFFKTTEYNAEGGKINGTSRFARLTPGGRIVEFTQDLQTWTLDQSSTNLEDVYYDSNPKTSIAHRTAQSVGLLDTPRAPVSEERPKIVIEFDAYLVCNGYPEYEVQWSKTFEFVKGKDPKITWTVKGERLTRGFIASYALADRLDAGLTVDPRTGESVPVTYPNPVPKDNR